MLSDEDRDIDGESDDESQRGGSSDKRAHHNALERKRRDHIKDSFSKLRDAIPSMTGDKLSRAQILKKASEYITYMRKKNSHCQVDIENLRRQNSHLEAQIRALEKAKNQGNFASVADILRSVGLSDDPPQVSTPANDDLSLYDASESESSPESVLQPIAPGQSLLLTAVSSMEPSKKRVKIEVKPEAGNKKRSF